MQEALPKEKKKKQISNQAFCNMCDISQSIVSYSFTPKKKRKKPSEC
jgi:hypothetical protein